MFKLSLLSLTKTINFLREKGLSCSHFRDKTVEKLKDYVSLNPSVFFRSRIFHHYQELFAKFYYYEVTFSCVRSFLSV